MKTVGYIVQCSSGGVMVCAHDQWSGKDQLYFSSYATLFASRKSAQRAIDRKIAERPTFEQEFGKLSIKRLESQQRDEGER